MMLRLFEREIEIGFGLRQYSLWFDGRRYQSYIWRFMSNESAWFTRSAEEALCLGRTRVHLDDKFQHHPNRGDRCPCRWCIEWKHAVLQEEDAKLSAEEDAASLV
jgi:hypothetical protein